MKKAFRLFRPFQLIWNAVATDHGRRNVKSRLRTMRAVRSSAWRQGLPLSYKLANGVRFVVHQESKLSRLIYTERAYEPLETKVVTAILRPGDIFFDIGANVGYFSVIAAAAVRSEGRVYAFEPGTETYRMLEATIRELGIDFVKTENLAVSDETGEHEFWVSLDGGDAQQGLVKLSGLGTSASKTAITATTLDDYISGWAESAVAHIKLVKCDVEGAEVKVLRGASRLTNSEVRPVWLVEHNRQALKEQGHSSEELCAHFENHRLFFVPLAWPPSIALVDRAQRMETPARLPDECNLVAVPRSVREADIPTELRNLIQVG